MPVYEYRCIDNGHQFEQFQPVGAAPPACPICGRPTRRVYNSVGIIFKGSGFHVTDYRRPAATDGQSGDTAAAKAAKGESAASGGGGTSGSSSKS